MFDSCFIVCDGGNGSGKGTVLKAIESYMRDTCRDFIMTREPGGTPIGEKIREIILNRDTPEMAGVTELMLFAAARAQHVREKIFPALNEGKIVVSDRFDSSTIAFQHYGRGMPMDLIEQLGNIAIGDFRPDMTIILDLDPAVGLERVLTRGDNLDRMERENIALLQRARQGYLIQAREQPHRFTVIDASKPLNEVVKEAIAAVTKVIAEKMPEPKGYFVDSEGFVRRTESPGFGMRCVADTFNVKVIDKNLKTIHQAKHYLTLEELVRDVPNPNTSQLDIGDTSVPGYFVDWDGFIRKSDSPGAGMRCLVEGRNLSVLDRENCHIFEATHYMSVDEILAVAPTAKLTRIQESEAPEKPQASRRRAPR